MKKIKKILPVLLGVMVFMFGTLTVCAASNDEYNSIVSQFWHDGYSYVVCVTDSKNPDNLYIYSFNSEPFYKDGCAYFNGKWSYWTSIYSFKKQALITNSQSVEYGTSNMCMLDSSPTFSIVYVNNDLYYVGANKETDKPFFRGPAPLVAVAEVLPVEIQDQTKVILTIAIACLALLIILLVLPKKLPRFLNR